MVNTKICMYNGETITGLTQRSLLENNGKYKKNYSLGGKIT
jgi:hypothetical protein